MTLALATTFLMVDMGLISFYLGLKIQYNREKKTLKLSQSAYIDKIFEKFYFNKANIVQTPIEKRTLLILKMKDEVLASKREKH